MHYALNAEIADHTQFQYPPVESDSANNICTSVKLEGQKEGNDSMRLQAEMHNLVRRDVISQRT